MRFDTRWKEGCRNTLQLWREVYAQGYGGTRRQVTKWVCRRREVPRRFSNVNQRQPEPTNTMLASSQMLSNATLMVPSAKRLAWLLVKVPENANSRFGDDLMPLPQARKLRKNPKTAPEGKWYPGT